MILTIASQKGGVGKTTAALNLGYSLGRKGKKVLVVDGDPQGGFSEACNLKKQTATGLLHALTAKLETSKIIHPLYDGMLHAVGSGVVNAEDIAAFESAADTGQMAEILRGMAAGYDYMIIDAPVGVGAVVKALLSASDRYLIVINCKAGTMKTLPRLMRTADWVKKSINPHLSLLGVLVNMYDQANASEEKIYTYFRSSLPKKFFFETVIPQDGQFEAAGFRSVPVAMIQGGERATTSFAGLAEEMVNRTGDAEKGPTPVLLGPREENTAGDFYTGLLRELCERSEYYGAVIADEMGFPLADYNCPFNTEALAAFTSVLGDTITKAESILELSEANNITLAVNETDKIGLRRFTALNSTYFLLVICPQAAVFPGFIEPTVAEIVAKLTE